jgi:hypothetical protein
MLRREPMPNSQVHTALAADFPSRAQTTAARCAGPVLVALAALAVVHLLVVAFGPSPVRDGLLLDTDSYMKLVRLEQLLATGGWYDAAIARSNAPFGETLHWTRLFDILVILLALPLTPFMSLRDALFWSGAAISPLMSLATMGALIWAARPLLRESAIGTRTMVALLTMMQPPILGYTLAGRADHHALLMLIFVLIFGAGMRSLRAGEDGDARRSIRLAALAGGVGAVGIWASVEMLVAAGACAAGLGLAWLLRGGHWLRGNLAFAAAFVGALAVALAIERPLAGIVAAENDRISILHVVLAGALLAFWLALALARAARLERPTPRLAFAAAGALAILAALWLLFPQLLASPFAKMDPRIVALWLDRVTEMRTLWPATIVEAADLLQYLGLGLVALPFLAWSILAERRHPAWLGRALLALGIAAAVPIAIMHRRFAPYPELLFGLAVCGAFVRLFARAEGLAVGRGVVRVAAVLLVFMAPSSIGSVLQGRPLAAPKLNVNDCSVKEIAAVLADPKSGLGAGPLTILTSVDLGPELLYRTPHRVVGTPYHRNADGIYDTFQALSGSSETARRIAYARSADLFLVCRVWGERAAYAGKAGTASFQEQLVQGRIPDWLAPLALPEAAAARFAVFRVISPQGRK